MKVAAHVTLLDCLSLGYFDHLVACCSTLLDQAHTKHRQMQEAHELSGYGKQTRGLQLLRARCSLGHTCRRRKDKDFMNWCTYCDFSVFKHMGLDLGLGSSGTGLPLSPSAQSQDFKLALSIVPLMARETARTQNTAVTEAFVACHTIVSHYH